MAAFSAALFTALLAWAVTATVKADRFGRRLRVNDQQALTQLCEYFDNIEISLMKSRCPKRIRRKKMFPLKQSLSGTDQDFSDLSCFLSSCAFV